MNYEEDETVKVTCTENGNVANGVIVHHHPNGNKTIVVEKTIKMVFKKHRGSVWTCEMRGREYVYDSRIT